MKVVPLTLTLARKWLPPRPKDAHKGTFGRVYILAGSRGMAGAAVLCAAGASRAGAGLVRLGIVKSQQVVAARKGLLEVTSEALPEDGEGRLPGKALQVILKSIEKFRPDVLVVGPGLGESPGIRKIVRHLLFRSRLPMVLDADGLNVMAGSGGKLDGDRKTPLVVTPHPGELSRLTGESMASIQKDRVRAAMKFARKNNCVCVLKGAGTIVSDGVRVFRNTTGNPGMAKGGTGDVLAGIIGGLWAQMSDDQYRHSRGSGYPWIPASAGMTRVSLKAAALGVFAHGLAGDLAAKKFTNRAMLASELAGFLPDAFKRF